MAISRVPVKHRKHTPLKRRKLTPPMIAHLWGIDVKKVRAWIAGGELPAMNGATHPGQRPRFLVDIDDLEAFEASRVFDPQSVED